MFEKLNVTVKSYLKMDWFFISEFISSMILHHFFYKKKFDVKSKAQ